MFTKLAKLLSPTLRKKEGFTLIELLIVVAIIAILAAIAIPQFSAYRKRGYNASANSDSRNLRTTQEAMFADFQEYGVTTTGVDTTGGHNGTGALISSPTLAILCGQNSATTCQSSINLSPNVSTRANTYADTTANKNVRFALGTKHLMGDVIYGVGSLETSPYRTGGVENVALGTSGTDVPTGFTATSSIYGSPWVALQ